MGIYVYGYIVDFKKFNSFCKKVVKAPAPLMKAKGKEYDANKTLSKNKRVFLKGRELSQSEHEDDLQWGMIKDLQKERFMLKDISETGIQNIKAGRILEEVLSLVSSMDKPSNTGLFKIEFKDRYFLSSTAYVIWDIIEIVGKESWLPEKDPTELYTQRMLNREHTERFYAIAAHLHSLIVQKLQGKKPMITDTKTVLKILKEGDKEKINWTEPITDKNIEKSAMACFDKIISDPDEEEQELLNTNKYALETCLLFNTALKKFKDAFVLDIT